MCNAGFLSYILPSFSILVYIQNPVDSLILGIWQQSHKNEVSPAIVAGRLTHEHREENKDLYKIMSSFMEDRINYTNLETIES